MTSVLFSAETDDENPIVEPIIPKIGSWSFSGTVTNESGDRFGYFFQLHREGDDFHTKSALIDGQTNQLVVFYEGSETLVDSNQLNWKVGRSFLRYNPINDSWIFGLKVENQRGFNFKVDMLKQASLDNEISVLRPGIELQALQTSRLNGHIQIGVDSKEQFVTGNNAWFGKVSFKDSQITTHDISTTFCRLNDDNGFYSANLKEPDATGAAIAGWRNASGSKVKMSQFVSVKSVGDDLCLLNVALPRLRLKLFNSLKDVMHGALSVAGFSKEDPKGFCFVTDQTFQHVKNGAVERVIS